MIQRQGNSKIRVPDIPSQRRFNVMRCGKDPKLFPTVKYIVVSKSYNAKKTLCIGGRYKCSKKYGIGIITTKNNYFFSEIHMRNNELTYDTVKTFKSLFLSSYILTPETRILLQDTMDAKSEPIYDFLIVVAASLNLHIRQTNMNKMLNSLNQSYKFIKYGKDKFRHYKLKYNRGKDMLGKMIENGCFEFISDIEWMRYSNELTASMWKSFLFCSVGILYMHHNTICRNKQRELKRRHDLAKAVEQQKQIAQTYNIDNED